MTPPYPPSYGLNSRSSRRMVLALNNIRRLKYHKTKTNKQTSAYCLVCLPYCANFMARRYKSHAVVFCRCISSCTNQGDCGITKTKKIWNTGINHGGGWDDILTLLCPCSSSVQRVFYLVPAAIPVHYNKTESWLKCPTRIWRPHSQSHQYIGRNKSFLLSDTDHS